MNSDSFVAAPAPTTTKLLINAGHRDVY